MKRRNNMKKNSKKRGFGSMEKETAKKIRSEGGKAAHAKGTAHEFTSEEARKAGKKSGLMKRKNAPTKPCKVCGKYSKGLSAYCSRKCWYNDYYKPK